MNEHPSVPDTHLERRHFLHKRWRRCACVWLILVTMPRTSNAAIDNFSFSKRPVLVLTDIRDSGNVSVVFEDCHALAGQADDARTVFRNVDDGARLHIAVVQRALRVATWETLSFQRLHHF